MSPLQPLILFNLPLLLLVYPPSKRSFVCPVQVQPLGPDWIRGTECRWKTVRRNKEPRPTACRTADWEMANMSSSREAQLSKLLNIMEGEGGLAHPAPVSMVIRS